MKERDEPTAAAASRPQGGPDTRNGYLDELRKEICDRGRYFHRQLWLYRFLRVVVIVAAGAVPVLATVSGVPRWTLGVLGAIAAAAEALQQLFQLRRSALQAMDAENNLDRELRLYLIAADPYTVGDGDKAFRMLVTRVERIRQRAEAAFMDTWQRDERAHTAASDRSPGALAPGRLTSGQDQQT